MRERAATGVLLGALAWTAAGCSSGAPDRAVPKAVGTPRFLSVSNEARAPLIVGSAAGVWRSFDAGRTWARLRPISPGARAIGYSRTRALISRGELAEYRDLALERLRGQPSAWTFGGSVGAIASDPSAGRLWVLVTRAKRRTLLYSTDEGRRFTAFPALGICPRPLALAATRAQAGDQPRLYVACGERGLLVSTNLGVSFAPVAALRHAVVDVATSMADPAVVAVATPVVRVSGDRGERWTDSGLSALHVAVDPRNPRLVFAIAQNGRLFASTDGGRTF